MSYYYEELGPDRFQHLCQALLVKEFPGTQCFPVGERDGGRDAVQYNSGRSGENRVFQVKFSRNPFSVRDPHKWVVDTLKSEIKKIKEIIGYDNSIAEYILITNVKGTAYPSSGSIDTLNALLEEELDVPIRAWWRDDLDRRCDAANEIKWSYPEILKATDLLQGLSVSKGNELQERRIGVVRAFASEQYEDDNEVRFKQVDLSNKITNLFVDVPVVPVSDEFVGKRKGSGRRNYLRKEAESAFMGREVPSFGAAEVFLDNSQHPVPDVVVLQGGPGQGKSTLAQYICQVHRMKILGKESFADLPEEHRAKSARFPIKVDLREYATWISGRNPLSLEFDEPRPPHAGKSLESFVSFLISQKSGGQTFTPDDFSAFARSSALLLVLDGLDEIADVKLRNEAVREIGSAYRRLAEVSFALRFLITTRPSALAEVDQFPSRIFHNWMLTSLTPALVDKYAELWSTSRRLPSNEYGMLKRVLSEKMQQPHMRDLARNPMQLAILLSVIHSRGSSLPDKRTALYDIYVDLFLAREAEKSEIVRRHQEILIDVHRYIAWVLHSEAETGGTLGKIEAVKLRELLRDYLIAEGRDPALANELFTGLAQRVVFLVGVVEGIFEFEVQPLREYFAAKFLYETAPYSPAGNPRKGTKDDRFDAIARSAHWLNVTRFYAGCFSKGELPSLVDRLEELSEDEYLGVTSQPLVLAATLVADWVFSQNARSLKKVIDLILNEDGFRSLVIDAPSYAGNVITLPDGCGRKELVEKCFEVLSRSTASDALHSICKLVSANSNRKEQEAIWLKYLEENREDSDFVQNWMSVSQNLGILNSMGSAQIVDVLSKVKSIPGSCMVPFLLSHAQCDSVLKELGLFEDTLSGIVEGAYPGIFISQRGSEANFSHIISLAVSKFYLNSAPSDATTSVKEWMNRSWNVNIEKFDKAQIADAGNEFFNSLAEAFLELSRKERIRHIFQAGGSYDDYVNKFFDKSDGNYWEFWILGIIFATSSPRAKRADLTDDSLFDNSCPIVSRMRYARLQSRSLNWWRDQFSAASEGLQKQVCALAAMAFCGPVTLAKLIPEIDDIVEGLSQRDADRFLHAIHSISMANSRNRKLQASFDWGEISPRLVAMMFALGVRDFRGIAKIYRSYTGNDPIVLAAIGEIVFVLFHSNDPDWSLVVDLAKRCHRTNSRLILPHYFISPRSAMPLEVARRVADNKSAYPTYVLRAAEFRIKRDVAEGAKPLSVVARQDGWFEEDD